jgi:hypothetical protein
VVPGYLETYYNARVLWLGVVNDVFNGVGTPGLIGLATW